MSHDLLPQPGDLMWTPADWAWIGGLMDVLMPAWHHGLPVLAHRFEKFDPEAAFALMAQHGVRNAFMPPTALKMMRDGRCNPASAGMYSSARWRSGGESLGAELLRLGARDVRRHDQRVLRADRMQHGAVFVRELVSGEAGCHRQGRART